MAGTRTLRILGWLWPLAALPLFFWLTLEGVLDFGGGEKDVLMVIPAGLYALLYWVAYFLLLLRKAAPGRAILLGLATALVALLLIGVAFAGLLGITAR